MAEGARDEVRYTAFLSYSHKDAAAAGKLHRRLESYRLPRRLVGKETPRGTVPERLWPIFRDRDELPAASDLSETVRTALAQSGALIILCSAHAAESLWVAEEIRVFRELHPDRPILAAILDGDPPACFPEALRAFGQDGTWHEPLATDLRRAGDGAHLGLLKLVAGITGVGLDELVQRDAARRIRRVLAITAAAVVAMLIMAALAVVAFQARAEAERQRTEAERQRTEAERQRAAAEDQIEFMLTELRVRLRRSVGQLDIMTAVNRHALAYYDGQHDLGSLAADSLERRARILHAMGEDYARQGNHAAALAAFRAAYRTTAEQLARSKDDPARILNHGQSDYWIGSIYQARRQWPQAAQRYRAYARAARRLIANYPNNPDYMREMAWGESNLGIVQRDGNRNYLAAQRHFENAAHWFAEALRIRPRDGDALDLANAYGDLADSYHMRSQWAQALDARLKAYAVVARLARAQPGNVEADFRLAIAERAVADESARSGELETARRMIMSAYDRATRLTVHDPRNSEWLLLRAKVECTLLSRTLALGVGPPRVRLRQNVRGAVAQLTAQHNPRLSELSPCLGDLTSG
ncbi:MAG: hypothetical protein QOJ53_107 [Sphingomonadales bacterium]|jgi:tetratricopeptide (TPR) repeat protein|nr:hypothetical protein [Sphingomonadales bacterium]